MYPPAMPSLYAVDLLVAVAQLQRYLQDKDLILSKPHPGHLDAMDVFRPHVLGWISSSGDMLCNTCRQQEAASSSGGAQGQGAGAGGLRAGVEVGGWRVQTWVCG